MSQTRSAINVVFYLICLGVVYGSLFPFQFSLDLDKQVITQFMQSWKTVPSRGDILGNIALFIPFGVAAYLLSIHPGRSHRKPVIFILTWLLVAAGSQLAQFFVPSRDPSIFDLYGNALGAILGWIVGRLLPRDITSNSMNMNPQRMMPLVLVLLWLAAQLIPFVPTIDLQAYKSAVKPLFLAPQWSWYECLLQANAWVVCFYLLHKWAGFELRWGRLLSGMTAILLLKIVIVKNNIELTDVVAMVIALGLWISLKERHLRAELLACSLLASLAINAIFPLTLRAETAVFGWIPFSGFLQGSMLANSTALCQKLFVFGSMVFLMMQRKSGWKQISLLIAVALLVLEIAQLWIASGTPELTDPLLFLAIAWLYSIFKSNGVVQSPRISQVMEIKVGIIAEKNSKSSYAITRATQLLRNYLNEDPAITTLPAARFSQQNSNKKRVVIVAAVYCAAAIIILKTLLGIPGIPYNIAELFRFGATGFDLFFFSLTMLSLGWGSAWLGKVFATTGKPVKDIPIALVKLTFAVYFLLWLSVTRESIADIAGSSVFAHRVAERAVLGQFGVEMIGLIGRSNVSAVQVVFEPIVRFGSLLGPFFIFSGLCFFTVQRANNRAARSLLSGMDYAAAGICLMLCLYIYKVIAFDWSSTDNLNELIARDGPWGLGGGGYLYLLVFLFCGLSALVTWAHFKHTGAQVIALGIVIASLPISWFLLNHGLEENMGKYGLRFSGVDFLLGPDRRNLISRSELFVRWSIVHMVVVLGLAFGASLYMYWVGSNTSVKPIRNKSVFPQKFRVYSDQWEFLQALADATNSSINDLVQSIIRYFGDEMAVSSDSKSVLEKYIDSGKATNRREFAAAAIKVKLATEDFDILCSVNSDDEHTESRIFRKLLEIFMVASQEKTEKL